MKKIAAYVSFAALGALSLPHAQAQSSYGLASQLSQQELSKPWTVSAALRGFYDDNWNTAPSAGAQSSFGLEVSPSFGLNLTKEQTYIGLNARYTGRFYEGRPNNSWENEFQFGAALNHAFSERNKIEANDSFVYSQQPDVTTAPGAGFATFRSNQNSVRNSFNVNFTMGLTPTVSAVVGYGNNWYRSEQKGPGSVSALLDRLEHSVPLSVRWQVRPSTVAMVGYGYGRTDYLSSENLLTPAQVLAQPAGAPLFISASTRNSESHTGLLGVDHSFTETLSASLRGGLSYATYPNAGANAAGDSVSPYVDASVSWTYRPTASVQGGVRHNRNSTDVAFNAANNPVTDQESTTVYVNVTHPITPKLNASLLGQAQFSDFNQRTGSLSENYYLLGLTFSYSINQFLSAEMGYNYDKLTSDIGGRGFDRNRVFLGLRATY